MGKLKCHCGYLISDSIYPCPNVGELKWQPESEADSQELSTQIDSFFEAIENNSKESWLETFFSSEYPKDLSVGMIVHDVFAKISNERGHSSYQCPECMRIYLQNQFYSDEYVCYEPRNPER